MYIVLKVKLQFKTSVGNHHDHQRTTIVLNLKHFLWLRPHQSVDTKTIAAERGVECERYLNVNTNLSHVLPSFQSIFPPRNSAIER